MMLARLNPEWLVTVSLGGIILPRMTPIDAETFSISQAPAARWPRIRQFVDANLADDARRVQWHSILDSVAAGQLPSVGLLEARSQTGEDPWGVVWVQAQDGRVANLLIPTISARLPANSPFAERISHELLEAAVGVAAAGGARLVQALLETDAGIAAERLRQAGFVQVAELLYLVSSPESFPSSPPAESLEFDAWSDLSSGRFEAVVERTYVGTRDCPQLNGVRLTAEVLAGYRSAGRFEPSRWLLARHDGADVGCLLVVEHPQKIWELAYMGLAPEARGQGWGLELTRYGQWMARQGGASRFVLAVDATNAPALRAYAAAGLTAWDRRGAWLKILDPANRPP